MTSNIYELGSSLQKLLSTLKKNREYVGTAILKTQYKNAYEELLLKISQTATAFAKDVVLKGIILNPDISLEKQVSAINQAIADSGLLKEMGKSLSRTYDVETIHHLALELRRLVELALWPYINLQTCLVVDLFDLDKDPVIYNTLTQRIYENDTWTDSPIDLQGKLLIYSKSTLVGKENDSISYEQ
ncbi:hypothetical protein NSB24_28680 [Blautia coccoides]|uniref:Uncharacterized protein n=1 Tax=Blautia producta TaxID=33035 RepID=A0ABZ0U8J4_9FIRM|nr:hypothetical protein [Blautia coccoides]MCR1990153.1 hypothetical protein [Blautia coccoides]TCO52237.1 hypothetical protein EV205_1461 [Blautia coccoides]WPX72360.1 hypothetical protein BLCOC_06960 [Blautia coccoides]SUY05794.1 Uncharacterised protein [Blautia coccoides]